MQKIFNILIFMMFMTGGLSAARAETVPQPHHAVRIFVGKHNASDTTGAVNARNNNTYLASFISGRLAPLLGASDAHNVQSCADCAVVVQ